MADYSNATLVFNALRSLGVAPQTASGAVGSLMGESGANLNPAALNRGDGADGSDSIGMGQWNASRAAALRNLAAQAGTSYADPAIQTQHIKNELQGSHKHVLNKLLAAGDNIGAGQSIWTRNYEVAAPATAREDRRLANAQAFYNTVGRTAGAPDPETTGAQADAWSATGKAQTPNYTSLPNPALSPQFQTAEVAPGTAATLGPQGLMMRRANPAIGPIEVRDAGPMMVNAMPGQPNVSNPAGYLSGGLGGSFDGAFPGGLPLPARPPGALPNRPTGIPADVPTAYTSLRGDPTAAQTQTQTQAPAQSDGFLGINSTSDFGKRLERMAAWIAPPGNASAALGFRNADENEKNNVFANRREDQAMELKKQIQTANLLAAKAPKVSVDQSENGAFRIIQKTNPITGQVTVERQAIPDDERDLAKKYPKAPAGADKLLNDDENALVKNIGLMKDGEELRDLFRQGQVDISLIGKTEAQLKTLMDSGDPRAANAMRTRAYLQGAINNTLRNEKGVQTDGDAKRVASEILSGNSSMNNKQMYDWMGRYMGGLNQDVQARSGRAANTVKRYGPDFDPDGYRSGVFGSYRDLGSRYYDSDRGKDSANPYRDAPAAPAPARVTSPLMEGLQRRFGVPGGR
ncbi:phage tail tip lysozyme [Methylobacterium sp. Leaf466]|uniref:phage tail tip lysozyme n=1 Tax=Methylobacterium sp. Leaf466 TaxID=1736386 RepID=UPI0006FC3C8B|nr:phage tail tip lysozyme [Methylobacterium sp. Leaf466]KQT82423.1 hypothetical protein ASG59_18700 [Methylobacterium sp. Leaf466]